MSRGRIRIYDENRERGFFVWLTLAIFQIFEYSRQSWNFENNLEIQTILPIGGKVRRIARVYQDPGRTVRHFFEERDKALLAFAKACMCFGARPGPAGPRWIDGRTVSIGFMTEVFNAFKRAATEMDAVDAKKGIKTGSTGGVSIQYNNREGNEALTFGPSVTRVRLYLYAKEYEQGRFLLQVCATQPSAAGIVDASGAATRAHLAGIPLAVIHQAFPTFVPPKTPPSEIPTSTRPRPDGCCAFDERTEELEEGEPPLRSHFDL
ncbi:MAG: hypothetical protein WCT24_01805 [Patescibacteria group bacterium]|jgi:hypothetical protein